VLEVAPSGTLTLAGTVAAAVLLLDKPTMMPPVGAGALRLTVPVTDAPPTTVVLSRVSDASWFDVVNDQVKSLANETPFVDWTLEAAFPPLITAVYVADPFNVTLGVSVALFDAAE